MNALAISGLLLIVQSLTESASTTEDLSDLFVIGLALLANGLGSVAEDSLLQTDLIGILERLQEASAPSQALVERRHVVKSSDTLSRMFEQENRRYF